MIDSGNRTSPVLAMGELLIDFIVSDGATSLETARTFDARAGGAPANVTVALARLGLPAAFCGVAGADPFGTRLRTELTFQGVDASRLRQTDEAATALAYAWKDDRGDGHFWILRGADTLLSAADAEAAGISELAALVVGSVSLSAQPARSAIERAVDIARDSGVPVVFDVNLRPTVWTDLGEAASCCERIASKSLLVKLSLDDAIGLLGLETQPVDAINYARGLGPPYVVLTDGDRGCWFATDARPEPTFVAAFSVAAVEPTGAGDAFLAALIARMIENGWSTLATDDVTFAAAAGALATTRQGAWDGLPSRGQLDAFLGLA